MSSEVSSLVWFRTPFCWDMTQRYCLLVRDSQKYPIAFIFKCIHVELFSDVWTLKMKAQCFFFYPRKATMKQLPIDLPPYPRRTEYCNAIYLHEVPKIRKDLLPQPSGLCNTRYKQLILLHEVSTTAIYISLFPWNHPKRLR